MAHLSSFEDLIVWQKSRELTGLVYVITRNEGFQHRGLAENMQSLSVTIGGKIANAFGSMGTDHSQQMLNLAKAACNGLKLELTAAYERQLMTPQEYDNLYARTVEIRQYLFELEHTFALFAPRDEDME